LWPVRRQHDEVSAPPPLSATWQHADDLRAQGNFAAARDLLEPAVDVAAMQLGPDSPAVVETQRRLATVHRESGELPAARRVLEEALDGGLPGLGDADPLILLISAELGAIADELGNKHEARRNLARVARYGPTVLGPDHPYVRTSQRYLGMDVAPLQATALRPEPLQPSTGPADPATTAPTVVPDEPGVYRPAARDAPAMLREDPAMPRQDPAMPRENPAMPRQDPAVLRADPAALVEPGVYLPTPSSGPLDDPSIAGEPPAPMPFRQETPGRQDTMPGRQDVMPGRGTVPGYEGMPAHPTMPPTQHSTGTPLSHHTGTPLGHHTAAGPAPIPGQRPAATAPYPQPPAPQPPAPQPPAPQPPAPQPGAADQNSAYPGASYQSVPAGAATTQPYDWAAASDGQWRRPAPDPHRPQDEHRSRGPLIAMALITLVVVAAGVAIGVVVFHRGEAPASAPSATSSSGPPRSAPANVALRDNGVSVTLTWTDPAAGQVPFVVAGGRAGDTSRALQTLPAGQTAYTLNGLNPALDYCFTVVAVYTTNEVATSALVCTQRNAGPSATPSR
jgi:hypothetical protein